MNNPYIGRVNQRLTFARHQLLLASDESSSSERMRDQSCAYAGVWHLSNAYRAYVSEVGAIYKLEKPELPRNAQELSIALEMLNKDPAEAKELLFLEQSGFIGDVQKAVKQIQEIEEGLMAPAPDKVDVKAFDPLALKDVTAIEERIDINAKRLSGWINEFKALISRHRELMIEC